MKLINQNRRYMLMDEAGGDGGAGGTGAPSLITPAGGTTPPAAPAGGDPAPPTKPAGGSGTPAAPAGGAPSDWRSSLAKELQDDATIKKFPTVEALAGAYVNAQKLIGADKIVVPNPKTATAEDWANVYKKLGLPESVDKYDVKFKEGVTVDPEFAKAFKENAYKAGVLPSQAQGLAEWFSDVTKESEAKMAEAAKQNFTSGVAELRKEWGNAFDLNIARANKLIKETGAVEHFNKMGYGSDPLLMKFMANAAEKIYKDAAMIDGGGNGKQARTPNEIKAAIGKMQTDVAYNSKDHPGHAAAVQEMQGLFAELHPSVDKK